MFLIILAFFLAIKHSQQQCLSNYEYYDFMNNQCKPCAANCLTCFDTTTCVACIEQYFLNSNNQCQSCPFGCAVCSNADSCSTCQEGLYMNGDGDCLSCANGVSTCTIALVESCAQGYFLLGDICAGCLDNCAKCYDFVECTLCMDGYYVSPEATQCLACGDNCIVCQNDTACTSCDIGYTLQGGICVQQDCSTISPFCKKCSGGICLECERGFYTNSDGQCSQGASILCTTASGPYFTDCQTSVHDCPSYSQVRTDILTDLQMTVCLPKKTSKQSEFIYLNNPSAVCPSSSCESAHSQSISFESLKAFYSFSYHISIKLYGSSTSHSLTVTLQYSNGTSLHSSSHTVDVTDQLSLGQSDSGCNSCPFGQTVVSDSFGAQAGGTTDQALQLFIEDGDGLFFVSELMIVTQICKVDLCSACSSPVSCNQCLQPYYLQMIQCVEECDAGFYKNGRTCVLTCPTDTYPVRSSYECLACQSPCSTCTTQTACLSCVQGFFLDGTDCVTNCSTIQLFTNLTSLKCEPCPNPCTTCQVISVNETAWNVACMQCMVGYLLDGGQCTYMCPNGTFANFLDNKTQCSSCLPECSECYIQQSICLSCQTDYLLNSEDYSCQFNYTCAAGYYQVQFLNICDKCHYPCKSCFNESQNCTSCLKGALLLDDLSMGTCPLYCPDGMFIDYSLTDPECVPCTSPCVNCILADTCLTCENGTFLYMGGCYPECPLDIYYENSQNNTCTQCIPPCASCISQNQCLSCTTGFIDLSLHSCVLQCNSSSYVDEYFVCQQCISPCNRCYSANFSCLQCQLPFILYEGECITEEDCQNLNRYIQYTYDYASADYTITSYKDLDIVYGICDMCTYPCSACLNSPVVCTSCASGYLLVRELSTCSQECPQSYFQEEVSSGVFECSKCDGNCLNCLQTPTNCTQCGTGMYLDGLLNVCMMQCADGFYPNNEESVCSSCQNPCQTCYNRYLCKSCAQGILYNKVCVDECPQGSIHNVSTNQCDICTDNCLTCSIVTGNCTQCPNGFYLYQNSCLAECPDQYFADDNMQTCQSCIQPCMKCLGTSSCIDCVDGYFLLEDDCLFDCPQGYYMDTSARQCVECDYSLCRACVDSPTNCTLCAVGYYMDTIADSATLGECLNQCPNISYPDSYTLQCIECTYPCTTCYSYNNCTSCEVGYLLYMDYCYSSCPIGFYPLNSISCQPCVQTCQICQNQTYCLKCISGYYTDEGGQCVEQCPIGFYQGSNALTNYPTCLACPPECLSCQQFYNCTECNSTVTDTLYLFNGLCLQECPIMHYSVPMQINTSTTQQCQPCAQFCNSCLNQTFCLQCLNSYIYNNQCYSECPPQTYLFNQEQCLDCVAPCAECTGQFACKTCRDGYLYFQNYCVEDCPEDIWYYPQNQSCYTTCPYNRYVDEMQCYADGCGGMLVHLNGVCLDSCPQNYFVDSSQNCRKCEDFPTICQNLHQGQLSILRSYNMKAVITFNQKIQVFPVSRVSITFMDMKQGGEIIDYSPSQITVDENRVTIEFEYKALYLYTINIKIPYARSQTSQQSLLSNSFTAQINSYNDYEEEDKYHRSSNLFMALGVLLSVVVFVLMVLNIILKANHYLQVMDFMQFVAATLLLQIQYSPVLQSYLRGIGTIILSFLPHVADFQPYSFAPSKYIEYHIDSSLLRSQGLTFIIFSLILVTFLVFILINHFKSELLAKVVERVRYRHLLDLFSIFMLPLLIFCFHFSNISAADIFACSVVIASSMIFLIIISYKLITAKNLSQIPGLAGDLEANLSPLGQMYTPFGFIRKIIFALVICIQPQKPISTLTLLLIFTILILVCLYFYQPFQNQITDYICIFMEVCLVLYVFILMFFALNAVKEQAGHNTGMAAIIVTLLGFLVGIGWLCYLTFIAFKRYCLQKSQGEEKDKKQGTPGCQLQERNENAENIIRVQNKESKNVNINDEEPSAQQLYSGKNGGQYLYQSEEGNNQEFRHWNGSDSDSKSSSGNSDKLVAPHYLVKKSLQKNDGQQ